MAQQQRSRARITVLISGSGSNLQALIDASNTPQLPYAEVVRVFSDRSNAYGLKRAEAARILTAHLSFQSYKDEYEDDKDDPQQSPARRAYDADLSGLLLLDNPDLVICAGFMRILTPWFLERLHARNVPIINLHPALHGDLVGARCIERAWEEFKAGKRTKTGVMVHYVIAEVDMGEPIVQKEVSIQGCESLEDLQMRMREVEHVLIVEAAKMVIEKGRL